MKNPWIVFTIFLLAAALLLPCTDAFAATDGFYSLTETTAAWDGTDTDRLKAASADYDHAYGDESAVTYTLPWGFAFYGQTYNQITLDTNGNVWFSATGSSHSFNLASTGRGPVISVWNNDLSSYFQGGVFIQHKTNPERVVVEWLSETYTEEAENQPNNFEVVIFPDGTIRFDYKSFITQAGKDFGSGIFKGNGTYSINLTSNYGNVFSLAGRSFSFGFDSPKISVSPASDSFGNGYVGAATQAHTYTIANTGTGTLAITQASLGGSNADQFSITGDNCSGHGLVPSATCTIQAAFSPTTTGLQSAELQITSSDISTPLLSISLNGTGVLPTLSITKTGTGGGTVTSSIGGISCGAVCSALSAAGIPITLTAVPDPTSTFVGWSGGGCSGTQPCTINLSGDTSVFAIFAATPPSISQPPNQWVAMGPGGVSASVVTIDPHDPNTIYAGTNNAGVFLSTDGGATWNDISSDLPPYSHISVLAASYDAAQQQTILNAGTTGGIYRSSDGGAHWVLKQEGGYENIEVDPHSPQVLYAVPTYGTPMVFKSSDWGNTWNPLNVSTALPYDQASGLVVDPTTTPATLYLATNSSGIYCSIDGGSSWSQVNNGLPTGSYNYVGIVEKLVVDPTPPASLYVRIFNSGETNYKGTADANGSINWEAYAPVTLPDDAIITGINTKTNPATLYASGQEFYRSTDRGVSWQTIHAPYANSLLPPYVLTIDVNQSGQETLYSPAQNGIMKSTDSGVSWTLMANDIKATSVSAFAIDPGNPAVFYAELTYNKLMKSEDSGQTWTEIGLNPPWTTNASPSALLVDPTTTPSTVYAGTYYGIYKSTDGGVTWQDFNNGLSTYYNKDISKFIRDPRTNAIYAGGYSSGLFRLDKGTDGGGTWQRIIYWNMYDFVVDPFNVDNLYFGYGAVYKSTNGGPNWSSFVSGWPEVDCDNSCTGYADAFNLTIDPFNPDVVYATSGDGLYKWDNIAQSWMKVTLTLGPVSQTDVPLFDPNEPGTMYIATDVGVYKSNDSGTTWQRLSGAEKVFYNGAYYSSLLMLDPINPQILYATMSNLGSGVLRFIQAQ